MKSRADLSNGLAGKIHPYVRVYVVLALAAACAFVKTASGFFILSTAVCIAAAVSRITWKVWITGVFAAVALAANIFILSTLSGMMPSETDFSASYWFIARCFLAYLAMSALTACTEPNDLVGAMSFLRMPVLVIALAGFSIRWQRELAQQIQRVNTARLLRGGDRKSWLGQARDAAAISVSMLVRAFDKSERIAAAMECRGFQGKLPRPMLKKLGLHDSLPMLAAAAIITAAFVAK